MKAYFSQLTRQCFRNPLLGPFAHRIAPGVAPGVAPGLEADRRANYTEHSSSISILHEHYQCNAAQPELEQPSIKLEQAPPLSFFIMKEVAEHQTLEECLIVISSLSESTKETLCQELCIHELGLESLEEYVTGAFFRRQILLCPEAVYTKLDYVDRKALEAISISLRKSDTAPKQRDNTKALEPLLVQLQSIKKRWQKELSDQEGSFTDADSLLIRENKKLQIEAIEKLIEVYRTQPKGVLFAECPKKRASEYEHLAQRMLLLLSRLSECGVDAAFLPGEGSLSELPQVCYSGWEERIEAFMPFEKSSSDKLEEFILASAQKVRRHVASTCLIPALIRRAAPECVGDAHYQKAGRQLLNIPFSLGISEKSLGVQETSICLFLLSNTSYIRLNRLFRKMCRVPEMIEQLKTDFSTLSRPNKELYKNQLCARYKRLSLNRQEVLFDKKMDLKQLGHDVEIANEKEGKQRYESLALLHRKIAEQEGVSLFSLQPRAIKRIYSDLIKIEPRVFYKSPLMGGFCAVKQLQQSCKTILQDYKIQEAERLRCQLMLEELSLFQEESFYQKCHRKEVREDLSRINLFIAQENAKTFRNILFEGDCLTDAGSSFLLMTLGIVETSAQECSSSLIKSVLDVFSDDFSRDLRDSTELEIPTEQWKQLISEDITLIRFAPKELHEDQSFLVHTVVRSPADLIPLFLKHLPKEYQTEKLLIQALAQSSPALIPELYKEFAPCYKSASLIREKTIDKCAAYRIPSLLRCFLPLTREEGHWLVSLFQKCSYQKRPTFFRSIPLNFMQDPQLMERILNCCEEYQELYFSSVLPINLKEDPLFMRKVLDRCSNYLIPDLSDRLCLKLRKDSFFMVEMLNKCSAPCLIRFFETLHESLRRERAFIDLSLEKCPSWDIPKFMLLVPVDLYLDPSFRNKALERCAPHKVAELFQILFSASGNNPLFFLKAIRLSDKRGLRDIFSLLPQDLLEDDVFLLGFLQQISQSKRSEILKGFSFKRRLKLSSQLLWQSRKSQYRKTK